MATPGAHLLGRRPSKPDARDYPLRAFLPGADPLEAALAALMASHSSKATKAWATIATQRILGTTPPPAPTPVPTPSPPPSPVPSGDVVWADADRILDQGDTGHCVGFGMAGWGDTLPIDDHFVDADGHAIYYECKIIDGEPGQEDGSEVRSGATAMRNRGRLNAYAFASGLTDVLAWLDAKGPIVLGTDWLDNMFDVDSNGFVNVTGAVAGGHCYVAVGDLPGEHAVLCQNSWAADWGQHGRFKLHYDDLTYLLDGNGEACAAVELPAA